MPEKQIHSVSIFDWIKSNKITSEDLDEMVHSVAAHMASNANNEGISGQIDFLILIAGWDEDSIKGYLTEYDVIPQVPEEDIPF